MCGHCQVQVTGVLAETVCDSSVDILFFLFQSYGLECGGVGELSLTNCLRKLYSSKMIRKKVLLHTWLSYGLDHRSRLCDPVSKVKSLCLV